MEFRLKQFKQIQLTRQNKLNLEMSCTLKSKSQNYSLSLKEATDFNPILRIGMLKLR